MPGNPDWKRGVPRPPTQRERAGRDELAKFVEDFYLRTGCSPTIREIARAFDTYPSAIHGRLKILARDGRLRAVRASKRTAPKYLPMVADGTCPRCGQMLPI